VRFNEREVLISNMVRQFWYDTNLFSHRIQENNNGTTNWDLEANIILFFFFLY